MGGMGGMGRGGPNTSAGRMTGGAQRGALPPPTTTFADVAGVDEAKEELAEIVDILKRPEHYTRLGARPPSGVLLAGSIGRLTYSKLEINTCTCSPLDRRERCARLRRVYTRGGS